MQIIRHYINSILAALLLVATTFAPQTALAYQNLSIEGSTTFSSITLTGPITGNVTPSVDNTYDVGSTSLRWRTGYFGTSVSSTLLVSGAGTVSAPAYTFSGDTDTGVYRFGANSVGISAGGAVSAYFQSGKIFVKGSYGTLADGDGYYFGDNVRGLRFLTGDDFEFAQWHVGGQRYETVYNGSTYTRYVVFDAPTKRSAFSSSVDLRNYTPNTDLEVIGTASTTALIVSGGTVGTPGIRLNGDADTGIYSGSANNLNFAAGGVGIGFESSLPSFRPVAANSNAIDLGRTDRLWRHGYFGGQVSSTSLIASATSTIGRLGLGNNQDHDFATALMKIKHTPSVAEAATLDYIQMVNTSSTRDMAISFLDDTEMSSILRISAFGRNYASGDFGFSPANMAFFETVSGTVMLAGDGIAVFNAPGVFRPITGLGFGNNDNIDPFNATASTTITNGNMASASLDFPNSAAAGTQDLTITVNGAADGDECQLGVPNALASRASEAFTCFVSAANTITVRRTCVAAGCGDPGAATVKAGFFARQ